MKPSICLLGVLIATSGCKAEDEAPEIPTTATLTADTAAVEQAPTAAKNADPQGSSVYTNFANAWVRVQIVRLYAAGIVAMPATVMGLALTQEPAWTGSDWHWSITVGQTTADLYVAGGVLADWDVDLEITNLELTNYLWVTGDFANDLSEGTWRMHDANLTAGSDEVLDINWTYISETDRSLQYENVNSTSDDFGDDITFTRTGDAATLVYTDVDDSDNNASIEWNTTTGAGSIQVPGYNGGAQACWDDAFENISCP